MKVVQFLIPHLCRATVGACPLMQSDAYTYIYSFVLYILLLHIRRGPKWDFNDVLGILCGLSFIVNPVITVSPVHESSDDSNIDILQTPLLILRTTR